MQRLPGRIEGPSLKCGLSKYCSGSSLFAENLFRWPFKWAEESWLNCKFTLNTVMVISGKLANKIYQNCILWSQPYSYTGWPIKMPHRGFQLNSVPEVLIYFSTCVSEWAFQARLISSQTKCCGSLCINGSLITADIQVRSLCFCASLFAILGY